jgi:hypothetical protein
MKGRETLRRSAPHLAAMALLAVFMWQTGEVGRWSSATADEPIYIRSGLMILDNGDVSLNEISSPFLFKTLNALPLLGLQGAVPVAQHQAGAENDGAWSPLLKEWRAGTDTVRALGPDMVLPLARMIPRLTGILLALLIYAAAFRALGAAAALCSLAVYVLLPEIVAHSSLATLEAGLGLTIFLTLAAVSRFMKTAAFPWAVLAGIGLGAALLTKTTGTIAAGFVGLALVVRWILVSQARGRIALGFLIVIALSWVVLNGAFSFQGTFESLAERPDYPAVEKRLNTLPGPVAGTAKWYAEHGPVLLPRSFVNTLLTQAGIAGKGKLIFFNGEYSETGWWWLMPLAFLIKMPLPFLALILFALLLAFFRSSEVPWIHVGFAIVLLLSFTLLSRINYGVRYLYPALPGLAMVAGAGLIALLRSHWFFKGIGLGLLGWMILAYGLVHPHPLSYANEASGGPEKLYRVLGDSNVDWGQDLPALAEIMDREGIPEVRLSYFGSDDPAAYGIVFDPLPSIGLRPKPDAPWWFEQRFREHFDLVPGVYAISANNLNGLFFRNRFLFSTFQSREPDFRAGYSILLYDLRREP